MARRRKNFERTYNLLRWFFEKADTDGTKSLSLDPNAWLFRKAHRAASGFSDSKDKVATIRILIQRLWTGAPPCLDEKSKRLSPGEKQHLLAEFFGGDLARKSHHGVMLTRALKKIDAEFEKSEIFQERVSGSGFRVPGGDIQEYARIKKLRENVIRE